MCFKMLKRSAKGIALSAAGSLFSKRSTPVQRIFGSPNGWEISLFKGASGLRRK